MADLFKDPRLPDYYSEHDWRSVRSDDSARDRVIDGFLNEELCVVHGLDLNGLDFDFLGHVDMPQTWEMKKFMFGSLLDEVDRKGLKGSLGESILRGSFAGDQQRMKHFVEQLRVMKRTADIVSGRLLQGFNVEQSVYVSRFSETRMENLHFDLDASSDDHEAFRLYINLDKAPRFWATSYQCTQLVETGGQRLVHDLDDGQPAETILKRVTTRAFGGWNQRATERASPRHLAFFDPGDVWLVDGRSISHQVLTGHRVLTIYAKLPHKTNPHLQPTFAKKLRSSLQKARQVPVGAETAQVSYYTPDQITAASDLKADWAKVFGETQTGRIRRFEDSGLIAQAGTESTVVPPVPALAPTPPSSQRTSKLRPRAWVRAALSAIQRE
jgi:hypothetical protein